MNISSFRMIPEALTPRQLKDKFLENNPNYEETKDNNPSIGEFHTIDEDDEVWIMQCPKGTDVSVLKNQQIKLPGRSNQHELETVAVEYPQPISHAFGHKNRKGHGSIKIIPILGSILLRSRLKTVVPPDDIQREDLSGRVPMPTGIKERHPLHGKDYESKLQISHEIAERLKRADEIIIRPTLTKKSKKNKTKEPVSIAVDSDDDVVLVTSKKSKKKKKRRHTNDEEMDSTDNSMKRKKNSDDVAEDLQWIQNL